jgi:arylsulfatase A-like enzyme
MPSVEKSYTILADITFMDNVLLVTIDSLRAFRFLSEDSRELLSSFDRLLDNGGMSFSSAFATGPMTKTSFPGILHGSFGLDIPTFPQMDIERPSLASSLRDCGIPTAGFTSNPFLSREFRYDRGFDRFRDYQNALSRKSARLFPRGIERASGVIEQIDRWLPVTIIMKKLYELASGESRPYVSATQIVDDTMDFLLTIQSPFFCWAHFMDVHHPCFPPKRYRDRQGVASDLTASAVSDMYSRFVRETESLSEANLTTLRRLYRAAIAYVDDELNRLLDELEARGSLEKTLVIVTSDHGELFGEHGQHSKQARLYDELIQVPLVFSHTFSSLSSTDLISLIDIPPLVHEVFGCSPPSTYASHSPLSNDPRELVVFEHVRDNKAIIGARSKQWRYVIDDIRDEERLTELTTGQVDVLPKSLNDDAKRVKSAAVEHLNRIAHTDGELSVSADVRNRLAELGYLE